MSGPIADLSYRNYDGPLAPANMRWWVIAKMTMRNAFKKRIMWVFMCLAAWYYLAMVFTLYVIDQMSQSAAARPGQPNLAATILARLVWKDQFVIGFSYGQMLFMIITLIIGAGAIANDNRANALLVYLSKPSTKADYLFGKWVGVFLALISAMLIPSMLFFMYGALSYRDHGFFYQDRWLLFKLLLSFPITAALHASLIIGFSSMFRQGRIAGATYSGVYFLTYFFTQMMSALWVIGDRGGEGMSDFAHNLVGKLFYASIDGLNIGLAKAVIGTDGSPPFLIQTRLTMVPAPPLIPMIVIVLGVSAICLWLAWTRIRAVEVVG